MVAMSFSMSAEWLAPSGPSGWTGSTPILAAVQAQQAALQVLQSNNNTLISIPPKVVVAGFEGSLSIKERGELFLIMFAFDAAGNAVDIWRDETWSGDSKGMSVKYPFSPFPAQWFTGPDPVTQIGLLYVAGNYAVNPVNLIELQFEFKAYQTS